MAREEHAGRKLSIMLRNHLPKEWSEFQWCLFALQHNYTFGQVKDIRVVKFDDDFGLDVKVPGSRQKDVWITL